MLKELEKRAVQQDFPFISILGHPQYYSRFGYVSAEKYKVTAPFDVPAEAFMIRPLHPNALKIFRGVSNMRKPLMYKQSVSSSNNINLYLI